MKKTLRSRLTYANVMASIAVFLVLGGGAYAATQLPKNSIGAKQLKKGSITPAKLSAAAKASLKGASGPQGPQGLQGSRGLQGLPGKEGPAGTALAYALVEVSGSVDPSGSEGITSADVSRDNTGTYCFNSIPEGTRSIVATANGQFVSNTESDRFVSVSFIPSNLTPSWTGCGSGEDPVRVTTFDQSVGGLGNSAFMIWFED